LEWECERAAMGCEECELCCCGYEEDGGMDEELGEGFGG